MRNTITHLFSSFLTGLLFICFSYQPLFAQNVEPQAEEEETFFLGSLSPVILKKDAVEINYNTGLTSLWVATRNRYTIIDRTRSSRLDHWLRASYGLSQNKTWDLGVELRYSHVRNDSEARSSPFRLLQEDTETGKNFSALTLLGLRLRTAPIKSVPELTFQSILSFPMASEKVVFNNQTERQLLGLERIQLDLVATYYKQVSSSFHYFVQAEWLTQFRNDDKDVTTHIPIVGLFLIKDFLNNQFYIYPGITYAGTFEQLYDGARLRNFGTQLLGSIGLQYQPNARLGVFVNGSRPFVLDSGSERFEFINRSYIGWSFGFRIVI